MEIRHFRSAFSSTRLAWLWLVLALLGLGVLWSLLRNEPPRVAGARPGSELPDVSARPPAGLVTKRLPNGTDLRIPEGGIESRLIETHGPDRATLVFEVEAGRRLTIADRRFTQRDADVQGTVTDVPDIKPGQPFDDDAIERELRRWEDSMHAQGYYEARASHGSEITEDGAIVSVNLTRGPRVAGESAAHIAEPGLTSG